MRDRPSANTASFHKVRNLNNPKVTLHTELIAVKHLLHSMRQSHGDWCIFKIFGPKS